MPITILGKKAKLVIPKGVKEEAGMGSGDVLEIVALGKGEILLRKADDIDAVRKMVEGRLPQWAKLEGKADRLLDRKRVGDACPNHCR